MGRTGLGVSWPCFAIGGEAVESLNFLFAGVEGGGAMRIGRIGRRGGGEGEDDDDDELDFDAPGFRACGIFTIDTAARRVDPDRGSDRKD